MAIVGVVGLAVGLLQMVAIYGGLTDWLGLPALLTIPVSILVGYVPLLGTILGMICAVHIWGWSWLLTILAFFPGLILMPLAGGWFLISRKTAPPD